jgi:hypothetical protein
MAQEELTMENKFQGCHEPFRDREVYTKKFAERVQFF